MAELAEIQRRAWANKLAKGFNTTDVAHEFGLTLEELGEAFGAWRKGKPTLGEELADVAIFLTGLAEMLGINLAAEVDRKLVLNEQRSYVRLPNGTAVKADAASTEDKLAGIRSLLTSGPIGPFSGERYVRADLIRAVLGDLDPMTAEVPRG